MKSDIWSEFEKNMVAEMQMTKTAMCGKDHDAKCQDCQCSEDEEKDGQCAEDEEEQDADVGERKSRGLEEEPKPVEIPIEPTSPVSPAPQLGDRKPVKLPTTLTRAYSIVNALVKLANAIEEDAVESGDESGFEIGKILDKAVEDIVIASKKSKA